MLQGIPLVWFIASGTTEGDALELKGDTFPIQTTFRKDETARNAEPGLIAGTARNADVNWIEEKVKDTQIW